MINFEEDELASAAGNSSRPQPQQQAARPVQYARPSGRASEEAARPKAAPAPVQPSGAAAAQAYQALRRQASLSGSALCIRRRSDTHMIPSLPPACERELVLLPPAGHRCLTSQWPDSAAACCRSRSVKLNCSGFVSYKRTLCLLKAYSPQKPALQLGGRGMEHRALTSPALGRSRQPSHAAQRLQSLPHRLLTPSCAP